MWILNFVSEKLSIRKVGTKICLIILALPTLIAAILSYAKNPNISLNIFLFQILILAIIVVWIAYAPTFRSHICEVETLYSHSEYIKLIKKYKFHLHMIPTFNSKKNEKNKHETGNSRLSKILFIFIWAVNMGIFLYVVQCNIKSETVFVRTWTLILLIILLVLTSSSYYVSCVNVWFLHRLSTTIDDSKLNKFPHNPYMPIASCDFQELTKITDNNNLIFLIVAMLFSFAHMVNIFFYDSANLDKIFIIIANVIILLLGLTSFFVIYVSSKVFLNRIVSKWQTHSAMKLENKLRSTKDSDFSEIEKIKELIVGIYDDKTRHSKDYISILVGITTIAVSTISILESLGIMSQIG